MRDDFEYVTVVYKVKDHAAFEARWNEIHELFKLDDGPVRVTALSLDDEITRKDYMALAVNRVDDHHDLREVIYELETPPSVTAAVEAFEAEYPETTT